MMKHRNVSKNIFTDREIARVLINEEPVHYKKLNNGSMIVIVQSGLKMIFGPNCVEIARQKLINKGLPSV